MAQIVVSRSGSRWIERIVPRGFSIILDGEKVASLRPEEQVAFEVSAGQHTVRARIDWLSSQTIQLNLAEHDQAHLRCELIKYYKWLLPWVYWYVILVRGDRYRYIDLHFQPDEPAS